MLILWTNSKKLLLDSSINSNGEASGFNEVEIMPLKKGSSKKTISSNVGELIKTFEKKGKIGTSTPKSKAAAIRQSVAIAYDKAGKGRKK